MIDWDEYDLIEVRVGTTIELPTPPFTQSLKQPDFFFRPKDKKELLPTMTVKASWSESASDFKKDMELLLTGGGGAIDVVILVNWNAEREIRASDVT